MKLLVIILALLALRYIHIGQSEKRYKWLLSYMRGFILAFQKWRIRNIVLLLLALVLPIFVIIYVLEVTVLGWLINLLLLWFTFWPPSSERLEVEGFIPTYESAEFSTVMIDQHGEMHNKGDFSSKYRDYSNRILIEANQNTFAIIFWFLLLGIVGAILYRFINLLYRCHEQLPVSSNFLILVKSIQQFLDWIPARLISLAYILAGNFVPAFQAWRHYVVKDLASSDQLLIVSGLSAVGKDPQDITSADKEENDQLIRLTDRALIVWLFLIALFVIAQVIY